MKVRQLLEKLSKLDPELEVFCYTEEPVPFPDGHGFRLLDIDSVDVKEAEKRRGEDRVPTVAFGKSSYAKTFAFINVIQDF